jgi:hypothetical protein
MENNHKDDTKMRIISFIIGVLVGAIISTGAFIISVNVLGAKNNNSQSSQMQGGGTPPEMPSGENGQPPAKPGESNNQNGNES